MINTNFLHDYVDFVNSVTSNESRIHSAFQESIEKMRTEHNVAPERLLTAAIGLSSESGEFGDLVKKCLFQGKPLDEATRTHMKKELGDVIWYLAQGCLALGVTIDDVIYTNIDKLEQRYPNGFEKVRSENKARFDV